MSKAADPPCADLWAPEFRYEHRDDGTVLMWQKDDLPAYLPTIADYLDKWADATPGQTWIARRDAGGDWQAIGYGQARERAWALGASLLDFGLGPQRPLLILSENSLEHALLGLACTYVGIPHAPVSPSYSLVSDDHAKLKDIAARLQPGALFADDGAAFATALSAIASDGRHVINVRHPVGGAVTFDALSDGDPAAAQAARAALSPDTVVKYLFTSGSTGSPKAVINTNGMICAMQAMVRDCYRFLERQPPVVLDWAPWNHTAAGNKVSYLALTNGGTYYIDDGKPVPGRFEETLRNLREIACTWYFNVPLGWDMLADALEREPALAERFFSRLAMMFYAGAGMSQHTWDRLRAVGRKTTGRDVLLSTSLGATETAPFALSCTEMQERAGNIGVPARGLTLKLVPDGDRLEARLKGPSITPGYYRDAKKTAEAFDDEGFYCLGDALRPADPDDFSRGFIFEGRIAENFKAASGTWVAVDAVRKALIDAMDGLISDAVIIGEDKAELGALLILSERARRMPAGDLHPALGEKLASAAAATTGSASRIRRAMILPEAPNVARGEITEKGSINQRVMRTNHADLVTRLYTDGDDVLTI